jgi:ribosomal protein L11 methyltransferase
VKYPALDVDGLDADFLLALVDDFNPSAVETIASTVTIFFPDTERRDKAGDAVMHAHPDAVVNAREVDDEDWARRSQGNLEPVTVGRITVVPSWLAVSALAFDPRTLAPAPPSLAPDPLTIVITPSMGFGTGHHATTRLCLRALQQLNLHGAHVLDLGTGSGILAIAARVLGAAEAIGIDDDRDAIQSAIENLSRNRGVSDIRFEVRDLRSEPLQGADVITANLTGALLVRSADLLLGALHANGTLIVSGLQSHERDDVVRAFEGARVVWEAVEDEWTGLILKCV